MNAHPVDRARHPFDLGLLPTAKTIPGVSSRTRKLPQRLGRQTRSEETLGAATTTCAGMGWTRGLFRSTRLASATRPGSREFAAAGSTRGNTRADPAWA